MATGVKEARSEGDALKQKVAHPELIWIQAVHQVRQGHTQGNRPNIYIFRSRSVVFSWQREHAVCDNRRVWNARSLGSGLIWTVGA